MGEQLSEADLALIERLEVNILEMDGIIRGSLSSVPYSANDIRSILTRVISETKEALAARTEGPHRGRGSAHGFEAAYIPMPLNQDGDGPMPEDETARISHQVWDLHDNSMICEARDEATAIIVAEALRADTPHPVETKVGAGDWVLVPREPTPEIEAAVRDAFSERTSWGARAAYRAMIAASPPPKWAGADPVAWTTEDSLQKIKHGERGYIAGEKSRYSSVPLYAALPVEGVTADWKPIETAPKDGTRILVGGTPGGPSVRIAEWGNGRYRGRVNGYEQGWVYHPGHTCDPTHWMPLPALTARKPGGV